MDGRKWQVFGYGSMMLLGILLLVGFVSYEGPATGSSPTPTPLPTVVMSCQQANDAIQAAVTDYHEDKGKWPTDNGLPGDIVWPKLVPNYMDGVPSIDVKCDWWVNRDPVGEVCIKHVC